MSERQSGKKTTKKHECCFQAQQKSWLLMNTFFLKFPAGHMTTVLQKVYLSCQVTLFMGFVGRGLFTDELVLNFSWSVTRSTAPSSLCDLSFFNRLQHKDTHSPLRNEFRATYLPQCYTLLEKEESWGTDWSRGLNPEGAFSPKFALLVL